MPSRVSDQPSQPIHCFPITSITHHTSHHPSQSQFHDDGKENGKEQNKARPKRRAGAGPTRAGTLSHSLPLSWNERRRRLHRCRVSHSSVPDKTCGRIINTVESGFDRLLLRALGRRPDQVGSQLQHKGALKVWEALEPWSPGRPQRQ